MEEVNDEKVKALQEALKEQVGRVQSGETLAELKGLSHTELEAIYSIGFNFYQTGRYEDAEKIFRSLVMLDFYDVKYAFAFASVLQAQKKFEPAIKAYTMVSVLDVKDPRPYFHMAECLLALGRREEAVGAIGMLEDLAEGTDERARACIAQAKAFKKNLEG